MRNGYVNLGYETLRFAGEYGYNWSSHTYRDLMLAYSLYINERDINILGGDNRFNAFPCSTYALSPIILCAERKY